ncbi:hypothetical protein NKH53_18410 [Mesorhizobium australicum]|uniref:phosphorylase family protein n=1 Tax=Mesorhizobium australicum TaxID=536018 RepID=UPI003334FFB8
MGIQVLIYCPMHEEASELQTFFPLENDLTEEFGFLCYRSKLGAYDIIVASQDDQGVSTTSATIRAVKRLMTPHLVVCVGIAGSLSDDVALGDVAFSQEIIDITENQKVQDGKTEFRPRYFGSNMGLDKRVGLSAVHPKLIEFYSAWQAACTANFDIECATLPAELKSRSTPVAVRGPIVCGPVIADKKLKTRLKSVNRKALAIETEASGAYHAIDRGERTEVLVIRGISDHADDTKKVTEISGKQAFRRVAAHNAASFLAMNLLHNSLVEHALSQPSLSMLPTLEIQEDPIERLLRSQEAEIEQSLAELSPEYRAKEKGYVLPVPRVRLSSSEAKTERLEPLDLISAESRLILEVPTSYPDRGLPWLYAKHLLGLTKGAQIVVPIVVHADALRPPLHGLAGELEKRAPGLLSNPKILPVVIITDLSFGNERKVGFILDEIKKNNLHTFVIGNGTQKPFFAVNTKYSDWPHYAICDVSFKSIVSFLCAQFNMAIKEAEVIAVRLSDTFRAFNLAAHPSYFAGIPKQMIARLTDANHRAELIDLAVTGFLSFIGAGDTKDINLKQRTRRLFLGELSHHMIVEKNNITVPQLVEYVKEYSKKFDFGLDALEFVNSLMTNGILHESGGFVAFSVTFIQNYLLAERLAASPDIARKYFNPDLNEIDFSTFELYAEIGLSADVLNDVSSRVDNALASFSERVGESDYSRFVADQTKGTYRNSGHYLTKGIVKPGLLSNMARTADYQRRVERAAEALISGGDDTERKQKVLDLKETAAAEISAQRAVDTKHADRLNVRTIIGRDWIMAIMLLGSAAEELNAGIKRKLASDIVRLAALISDDWIAHAAGLDFDSIKKELREHVENEYSQLTPRPTPEKIEELAEMIVDIVEMGHLSTPMVQIMNLLGDYARNRVLYESVKTVTPIDAVEELIVSMWKMELRDSEGLNAFKETLTKLSKDSFLRMMIASYLVNRAYWYRGSESGRSMYAAAVDACVKPLSITLPVDTTDEAMPD